MCIGVERFNVCLGSKSDGLNAWNQVSQLHLPTAINWESKGLMILHSWFSRDAIDKNIQKNIVLRQIWPTACLWK